MFSRSCTHLTSFRSRDVVKTDVMKIEAPPKYNLIREERANAFNTFDTLNTSGITHPWNNHPIVKIDLERDEQKRIDVSRCLNCMHGGVKRFRWMCFERKDGTLELLGVPYIDRSTAKVDE